MSSGYPGPGRRECADIMFSARIEAAELYFHTAPDSSVEFPGDSDETSTSGSRRTNLPDRVTEGVAYRDVRIDYAIAARLAEDIGPESG